MTEPLNEAAGAIADYAKKLEIASFYSNGDVERAKQVIAGTVKDFYAIKGRFSTTSSFGAFLAFLNSRYLVLNSVYAVISDSFALKDIKTTDEWRVFEKGLVEFVSTGDHDEVLAAQFRNVFTTSMTPQFVADLKKLFDEGEATDINRLFHKMVQDRMGFQGVSMSVDIEPISSVDMEMHSLTSSKMPARTSTDVSRPDPDVEALADEDEQVLRDREVKLTLHGSLILSPISGRDIGLLVEGDRIKIKILDTHPKAVHVLKAFNAYREEGPAPITGRIVSIRHRSDGGYTIYAIVAKGIYVKIDEMESNIKVAIDKGDSAAEEEDGGSRLGIFLIAGLALMMAALVGLLIMILT